MNPIHIVALVLLVVIFAISLWRGVNLGLVAIPGSFLLALLAGVPQKQVFAAFPTELVLLILGVTYLWNLVRDSGLAASIVRRAVALSHGRPWLLPWTTSVLTALICALGALPIAALVITLPVALEIARRHAIRPALMGIVTVQGACIGGLSPLNPWGKVVATQAAKGGVALLAAHFFLFQLALNLGFALLAFFVFGGAKLFVRQTFTDAASETPDAGTGFNWQQALALVSLLGFVALVLTKHDVGLSAFSMGLLLNLAVRIDTRKILSDMPWGMVMMIAGILVYMGTLESTGTLQAIGALLQSVQQQSLVRVGMTYLGTLMANFEASSVVVLGLVIPVVTRALAHEPSALVSSIQLALSATSIVVLTASPFHLGGGLMLAELDGDDRTFKDLLKWTAAMTLLLPLAAFLIA